ncbi:uncharacterized protein BJX67DRAFT_264321 [Aspergillus lucknowensis]|uniref:DUF7730 domain-containing protein n=1 Tax=Aspergillus lucknowensis TaxID=176173 RepID=A0ABR4LFB3_9EURO
MVVARRVPGALPKHHRSLSPPSCGNKSIFPGLKLRQNSRLFNQLNPDIRLLMYEEVLAPEGNQVVHITSTHKRLFGIRCTDSVERNVSGWQHACCPPMMAFLRWDCPAR